jgi:16S rRNA (guanine(966)-N(2))-methyltransferase RsmD
MRVIAGKYKSRPLKTTTSSQTRPTTDRNKESMFNMLSRYFLGGVILDLFGGSGGLGIEAMSRGGSYLYSNDIRYDAYNVIKENLTSLHIDKATVWKMDYKKALTKLSQLGVMFDLVILDPPYGKQLIDDILIFLVEHQMLQEDSVIMIEELKEEEFKEIPELTCVKRSSHGITSVSIYTYQRSHL